MTLWKIELTKQHEGSGCQTYAAGTCPEYRYASCLYRNNDQRDNQCCKCYDSDSKTDIEYETSQVKVHLKSNYQMYIQEETKESKLKRKAVQEELQRLYAELEENKNNQPHPLETLIDKL